MDLHVHLEMHETARIMLRFLRLLDLASLRGQPPLPCGGVLEIDISNLEVMPGEVPKIIDRLIEQIIPSIAKIKDTIEDQYPTYIKLTLINQRTQELHHQKLLSHLEEDEDE